LVYLASFMTSICDERGQELLYAGMPISDVLKQDMGIGGVISLLWFQRPLPVYACKFIEMCLMVTADHGPVSKIKLITCDNALVVIVWLFHPNKN